MTEAEIAEDLATLEGLSRREKLDPTLLDRALAHR